MEAVTTFIPSITRGWIPQNGGLENEFHVQRGDFRFQLLVFEQRDSSLSLSSSWLINDLNFKG